MTPTQLKEAIDNEITRAFAQNDGADPYDNPYEFAYRIAALTAECMVGEKLVVMHFCNAVETCICERPRYSKRIAKKRQLADEIKKLSE